MTTPTTDAYMHLDCGGRWLFRIDGSSRCGRCSAKRPGRSDPVADAAAEADARFYELLEAQS